MISFNNIPNHYIPSASLLPWLDTIAVSYNVQIIRLEYNFVDEATLLKMNQDYLQHDTHTDIITFSYGETHQVEAEIFISTLRLEDNALINKESVDKELLRLLSHGFLHCIGYNDHSIQEKEAMRKEENRCIDMFHVKQ